ncbi:MAG: glycosyltransferase family 4 protein [Bacteroidota bacterium]|nr:glycosyltransferase family 4 protein [Bacteroidota bacterium]MDP4212585.1 glycosyltransferase family 4 protein [Bacteroidota bacterium]MDP4251010.1 glycosyltransferase family 4 protein [Bacteroidota bacterium]
MVNKANTAAGLYVLGRLYPQVTGGMEIFNYYFLNNRLNREKETIYYLGENRTENPNGCFVPMKNWWPATFFNPVQFFLAVFRLRKTLDYAYLSYAEESVVISYLRALTLKMFKIPYIITIHWGKEPDWKFRFPYVFYFSQAHAVIGVSEPICIAFKKAIPQRDFLYIPPLIPFQHAPKTKPEAKKQLGYEQEERILLFAGSLKAMKNPDKIVETFRELGTSFLEEHNIRLILAGRGDMETELKARIENYQLAKYIRVPGLVSREAMPDYYRAAEVYIISSDYEGTSLSLMEAMFNQLPIIASDAPGINGMLKHEQNALLYETKNTGQMADTIKRIFTDRLLAEKLAETAFRDFSCKYSYEGMMEKYQSVFSAAIS